MFQKENIVEIKNCKFCNSKFEITDKDLEFYEKVSPTFGGKKYLIPTPSLCPDCREQRRLSWRNVRKLYMINSDLSGEKVISVYKPNNGYTIYSPNDRWSDKWDGLDYGQDFDFSRTFFEQFDELLHKVPLFSSSVISETVENSYYINGANYIKNSYLSFNLSNSENILYSEGIYYSKDIVDSYIVNNSNTCYECINCDNIFLCFYSNNLKNSNNCFFCEDSSNLANCIGCINLDNKSFCIFNKQYTKEQYKIKKQELLSDIKKLKKEVKKFFLTQIRCENHNIASEDCTGDYLNNSKNCKNCYSVNDSENLKYCFYINDGAFNSYDISLFGNNINNSYEGVSLGVNTNNCHFCYGCYYDVSNLIYCYILLNGSSNCFGCVGLKNKSYCILNKQYTKEEYEKLVPKIIEHMKKKNPPTPLYQGGIEQEWGEFFPSSISPFGYNETTAQEYFPVKLSEDKKYMITEDGKRYNVNMIGKDSSFVIPAKAGIYKNSQNFSIDPRVKHEDDDLELQKLQSPIFFWSDYEAPFPKVDKTIPAPKLPDDISKIPDDILNRAIMPDDKENEIQKPFRIIKQELEFYRKHNLPIPRKHPDQRHLDRMSLRNPRKLYDRLCDCEKCEDYAKETNTFKKEDFEYKISETNGGGQRRKIKTTYSPDREEIVYCQVCYDKEVY